ncbi:MAG: hypothetical protein ABSF86_02675, partial [Steroidobacteraceae bacterium]
RQWMRERASPRVLLRRLRMHLPDALESMKLVPKILRSTVREAADGEFRLQVESAGIEQLRSEIEHSMVRRDSAVAAAVLWLSGLLWLALAVQQRWLGWLQLAAALIVFIAARRKRVVPRVNRAST